MSEILSISSYTPKDGDKFFLDTNIWMYLYCSIGNYKQSVVDKYSNFYEKILNVDAKIYTLSLQVSEFFNAYCKLEYKIAKRMNPAIKNYKKDFRNSNEFYELMKHLKQIINKKILGNVIKIDDNFSKVDVLELMSSETSYDFNDEYFINFCVNESIMIVTNDRDLIEHPSPIQIITNLN